MSDASIDETVRLGATPAERWSLPAVNDRKFKIALAIALAIHLSFLAGVGKSKPRDLGKEDGREDAISVSLVTEQDLLSRSTIDDPGNAPPKPPVQPQPEPAKPEAQKPEPKEPPPPDPVKEAAKPEPLKPAITETEQPEPTPPEEPAPAAKPETNTAAAEKELPELFSLEKQNAAAPDSGDKKETKENKEAQEAKPKSAAKSSPSKPQKKQQKRTAALDLSTPSLSSPGFGGSASFARPPGITKSGLNDAFARAVIRALQGTMPQLREVLGRVTVRILLNDSGNVINVQLLSSGGNTVLGQEVVFAARQTSYPIPPVGSNVADRTFMVTYIYD